MWNPKEFRALIAQFAGIGFGLGGVLLLIEGIQATGKINVSSTLLSGQIESGSAGLILLFFSFLLICIPTLIGQVGGLRRSASEPATAVSNRKDAVGIDLVLENEKRESFRRCVKVTSWGVAIAFLFMFAGDILAHMASGLGMFLSAVGVVIGVISFISVIGLAIQWAEGIGSAVTAARDAVAKVVADSAQRQDAGESR